MEPNTLIALAVVPFVLLLIWGLWTSDWPVAVFGLTAVGAYGWVGLTASGEPLTTPLKMLLTFLVAVIVITASMLMRRILRRLGLFG